MTYAISRPLRMDLESFSRAAGVHPELVRRLAELGLIDYSQDAIEQLLFDATQLPVMARIQRLRAGFSLNYAAIGLVIDLLDRLAELEGAMRIHPTQNGGPRWTSTA
jgi:chaperone modulatory protein CbpM